MPNASAPPPCRPLAARWRWGGLAILATWSSLAAGATLHVGPGGLATIAEAARLAQDGDTVEIAAGTYRGEVAVWTQRRLTLRAAGGPAELVADGAIAEGKAIWVLRNGEFTVEDIVFRGARAAAGNGAGIRFERGRLLVRRCGFFDNEMGILTSNDPGAQLDIEDSEFAHATRGAERPLKHLLYVGHIDRVRIRGSHFHDGFVAHLVKSRARESDLRYNRVWDGEGGSASYEMDFPNGGVVTLIGNLVEQSAGTQNLALISFGAEGSAWPEHRLTFAHNTLVNDAGPESHFLRLWPDKVTPAPLRIVNNLLVGPGQMDGLAGEISEGNRQGSLRNPDRGDFRPRRGTAPVRPPPPDLVPEAEFHPPLGTRPLRPPRAWLPGAIQSSPTALRTGKALP